MPTRERLEQAIENAIAALDAFDGDADAEPSLGAANPIGGFGSLVDQRRWADGAQDDREDDGDDEDAAQLPAAGEGVLAYR